MRASTTARLARGSQATAGMSQLQAPERAGSSSTRPHVAPGICFLGDVMLGREVGRTTSEAALVAALDGLREGRPMVINLECCVAATAERNALAHSAFDAPEALVRALARAGVVAASVANNHSLDFGRDGLDTTIRTLRSAGIAPLGRFGADGEAEFFSVQLGETRAARARLLRPDVAGACLASGRRSRGFRTPHGNGAPAGSHGRLRRDLRALGTRDADGAAARSAQTRPPPRRSGRTAHRRARTACGPRSRAHRGCRCLLQPRRCGLRSQRDPRSQLGSRRAL
jgi:hypothetical protein